LIFFDNRDGRHYITFIGIILQYITATHLEYYTR